MQVCIFHTYYIRRKRTYIIYTRTYKRKDESDLVSASDDSGDELKVKFAREICYEVKDGTPGLKIRRGNTMQTWKWTPVLF